MTDFTPTQSMLNNYIQNKLSESATEQIELWLANNPDVMQDLQLDMMLKQGMPEPQNDSLENKPKAFSLLDIFTSRKLVPLHLLAYGLVGFLLFNSINTSQNSIVNTSATFIELEKQRGLDTSEIEVQTNNNKNLVLRLFPDSMTEMYSLVMQSKTSNEKIEFTNLVADDYGSITVTINDEKVSGKWEILLMSVTNNQQEQSYLININ